MTNGRVAFLFLLVAFGPMSLAAQQATPPQARAADPERTAVQEVIMEFGRLVQSGDLDKLDSFFPTRVHILSDNATTHSWAEYRDQYFKAEMAGFPGLKYAHSAVEATIHGDVAWAAFRREMSSSGAGGPAAVTGRGTAVLEKRYGRWIIVHMHMSN